jgi:RNA polymerase sigma-70 factor (ECF subfamily)
MMDTPSFEEIEGHRPYLMRYALAQLRDSHLAEEAVQDCLLAALENAATFRGGSSLRTWLTSILRFKVIDLQRKAVSERARFAEPAGGEDFDDEAWLDALFDETGHWRDKPQAWGDPEAALDQKRFWEAFERCLDKLPGASGRVFYKREILGDETDDICKAESITSSNCWVILHRARIGLRGCLEKNWFGPQGPSAGG